MRKGDMSFGVFTEVYRARARCHANFTVDCFIMLLKEYLILRVRREKGKIMCIKLKQLKRFGGLHGYTEEHFRRFNTIWSDVVNESFKPAIVGRKEGAICFDVEKLAELLAL